MPVNQDIAIASMYSTGVQIVVCMIGTCMAVATISLFVLCEDSCGGAYHYLCLSCLYIVAYMSGTWQLPLSLYLFCVMTVVVAPTTTRVCVVRR